jgi:predicted Zn-dependent protease
MDTPITYVRHPASSAAPKRVIPVAIDINFSPEQKQQLQAAISEWNYSLNGQMRLDIYVDHFNMETDTISYIYNARGFMILLVSRYGSVMFNLSDENRAISTGVGNGHEIYFLKEKVALDRIKPVAMHEIGHILGAYHRPTGLMRHEDDPVAHSCIDYETIKQVAEYNGLDAETMNWCQH